MSLNVLELIGTFEQGGSERQAIQFSKNLKSDKQFNVFVGCLERRGPLLSEIDWLDLNEIPEFPLSSFYDVNFAVQVRRCAAYLSAKNIRLVHTHDFYSNIFGMVSATLARVPCRIASKRETFSKTNAQTWVERKAFRLAHKIVANALAVKDFLVKNGVSDRKITVVYNGVDVHRFSDTNENSTHLPLELGRLIPNQNQVVTIVANLRSEVKDHSMFLRSAKQVLEVEESTEFIIAGEGELLERYQEEANILGIIDKVHFIGASTDVPSLLSSSDICVLSSRSEGFSNAILEYMASGKPVVATRVGGAAEAVIEGETGFLVDPGEASLMSQRIIQLLQDPDRARKFGENGRKRVKEQFSIEAQLEKTRGLYEELLRKAK